MLHSRESWVIWSRTRRPVSKLCTIRGLDMEPPPDCSHRANGVSCVAGTYYMHDSQILLRSEKYLSNAVYTARNKQKAGGADAREASESWAGERRRQQAPA